MTVWPRPYRTTRFVVQWETARPGHMTGNSGCADHMQEQECYDFHCRAFPTDALAMSFAADPVKCPSFCGEPSIWKEEWNPVTRHMGEWNRVGGYWYTQQSTPSREVRP